MNAPTSTSDNGIVMSRYPSANFDPPSNTASNGNSEPTFYESALMAATQFQQGSNWGDASVPPPPQTEIPIWEQPKVGSKCCGFCCDFRRAVIIINSVVISFSTYSILLYFNRPADMEQIWGEVIRDDEVLEELGGIEDEGYLAIAIIGAIAVFATIVPIYGAYRFDNRLIGFGVGFLILSFVTRFVVVYTLIEKADDVSENVMFAQPTFIYTVYAIIIALFVYAHIGLMYEINKGIMSAETYPREEYCCCCAPRTFARFLGRDGQTITYPPATTYPTGTIANGQPVAAGYPYGQSNSEQRIS